MKSARLWGLFWGGLSLSMAAFSAQPAPLKNNDPLPILKPFDVDYTLKASNIPFEGSATSILSENAQHQWTLSFKASALLMHYTETSRFIYNSHKHVQPIAYEMKKSIFGSDTVNRIQFNWQTAKATYYRKNKQNIIALTPGSLDDMSYQAQLRQDLLDKRPSLHYKIVEKHKLGDLQFKRDGKESLKTPLGTIPTLRLKTVRDNNKRETWIWLAPQWEYLPVKIKQRTGSQTFEAEISGGTFDGKKLIAAKTS